MLENIAEQESARYHPRKISEKSRSYSRTFDYLKNTSVSQGIDDLVGYLKKEYRQTKENIDSIIDPITQFGKQSISKLQEFASAGQPQLTFAYAGKMAGKMNYEQQTNFIESNPISDAQYSSAKSMYNKIGKQAGFTLVELLVVIAIIAVLAGMLFPAISKAMDATKKIKCLNNLKQIGTGMMMYTEEEEHLPWDGQNITYPIENMAQDQLEGSAGIFYCPLDSNNPEPTEIDNGDINSDNSIRISFISGINSRTFIKQPRNMDPSLGYWFDIGGGSPIFLDAYMNHKDGGNVLFGGGNVKDMKIEDWFNTTYPTDQDKY